jgi:hypothetical protein
VLADPPVVSSVPNLVEAETTQDSEFSAPAPAPTPAEESATRRVAEDGLISPKPVKKVGMGMAMPMLGMMPAGGLSALKKQKAAAEEAAAASVTIPPTETVAVAAPTVAPAVTPTVTAKSTTISSAATPAPAAVSGAPLPCDQCDCKSFVPHAFKKLQCNLCYHELSHHHAPVVAEAVDAVASAPPPAASVEAAAMAASGCDQCDCKTFVPHAFKKTTCNNCYHIHL